MTWLTFEDLDRQAIVTLGVVLLLLSSQAGVVLAQTLTHSASAGTPYETPSGLEVRLADDRDVDALPFAGSDTFADDNVRLTAPGDAAATIGNDAYSGGNMTVGGIDATSHPLTIERIDGFGPVTVSGGVTSIVVRDDVSVGDGASGFEVAASSSADVSVPVSDVGPVRAVDATGDVVASDTTTSDGSADLTFSAGTYDIRLQEAPEDLEIRDITTGELVQNSTDPVNVEVEFYGDDGDVQIRNTTTGVIDMSGLPVDQRFSVTVDAPNYVERQTIVPSLVKQGTAWILPQNASIETVEPRFVIEDPSNQFSSDDTEVIIQRPITINNTTTFEPVAGDRVGINGFDTILERDQRYRVIVRDPDSGAERQLGAFTPTQSEQVTLEVKEVEFNSVANVDGLDWTARYVTNENTADEIEFIFRDDFVTQTLSYQIYERGDKSNVLASGSATGNVTVTEPVPPNAENTVWTVEWQTTRGNGEELSATRPVSTDNLPVGPSQLPQQWQIIISMLALFGVAGLFGAANPGLGGIAVAAVGGFFFLAGWLPDATGGIMVMLAMLIAVLSYAGRRARGATA